MKKIDALMPLFDTKKFKVRPAQTLFEPTPKDIAIGKEQKRCWLCGNKLYLMLKRPMWYCKSNKHKRLLISVTAMEKHG